MLSREYRRDMLAGNSFQAIFLWDQKMWMPGFIVHYVTFDLAWLRMRRKSGIAEYSGSAKYSKWP